MLDDIKMSAIMIAEELISAAKLESGDIVIVGCSSSEILGEKIGTHSNDDIGMAVFSALQLAFTKHEVYIAAQCCEHLNRALIVEASAAKEYRLNRVNVVPHPKAGGSFATAAYKMMEHPVAVESVYASAGIDIGDTLIGMHLRKVAVPVRLSIKKLGSANVVCARTRLPFVGGERAHYDPDLM